MWRRIFSAGMPRRAWLRTSTCCSASRRRCSGVVAGFSDRYSISHGSSTCSRRIAQRLGHGGEVLAVARVVLVAPEAAGTGGGQESLDDVVARERRAQVGDVGLQLGVPLVSHGPGAHHGRHRADLVLVLAEVARVVLGEGVDLDLPGRRHQPLARRGVETPEPVLDVGQEADLAELAVGDDVQARLDLLRHHLGHRARHAPGVGVGVVGAAVLLLPHHLQQVERPGEAADVGGQDPVGAAVHVYSPRRLRWPPESISGRAGLANAHGVDGAWLCPARELDLVADRRC